MLSTTSFGSATTAWPCECIGCDKIMTLRARPCLWLDPEEKYLLLASSYMYATDHVSIFVQVLECVDILGHTPLTQSSRDLAWPFSATA